MKNCQKISNIIKKEFDSQPLYNKKCLKTKVKSYNETISINLHNNKITKEGSQCICLSVILIDSVYRKNKNYYSQVFLEECKYVVKEKFITDDIEICSDYSDKEDSNKENYNE